MTRQTSANSTGSGASIPQRRLYTPADIWRIFGVPRTTLFRWEQKNEITLVPRDPRGERYYTSAHIEEIGLRILKDRYAQQTHESDLSELVQTHTAIMIHKLRVRDKTGLSELSGMLSQLSYRDIREIIEITLEVYEPEEYSFSMIMSATANQLVKMRNDPRQLPAR